MDRRRAAKVMVVAVVLVAVCVTAASLLQTPTYEASAQVWVSPAQGTGNGKIQLIPNAPTPETLRALTQEMMHAIDSHPVAEEAIQRLGLRMDPAEVLDNLTVEQVENASFIVLTYEGTDPYKAKRIANTVSEVSSERISPISAAGSKFRTTVWDKAEVPESPASPHPWRNGLLTLVIGMALCAGTVVAWPVARTRVVSSERIPRQRLATWYSDHSIVERINEKKLLRAIGRRGKLTAVEAALESELSVEEADRILSELAHNGHLKVIVEDGKLLYSFWGEHGA